MLSVSKSAEWRRVDAIPRRTLEVDLTRVYCTPGGTQTLRPVQSAALHDISNHSGLLGAIGVGEGKTLITLLAGEALGAKRPLLILPAKLVEKTKTEMRGYEENWRFARPAMISYETLGRVNAAKYLDTFLPDAIIADEAQRLKNRKAAVTRRVLRYLKNRNREGQHIPCVFLSGTFTRTSLHEYWHLAALALPELPMPRGWPELSEWADAIDDRVEPWERVKPGALLSWGPADEPDELRRARLGFQKRLRETPGVVATTESELGASLQIGFLAVDMPDALQKTIKQVQDTWERPDGFAFADILSLHRYLRQLALGFYYRWREPAPAEWLACRTSWAGFVRDTISRSRKYDSELQVAMACHRGDLDGLYWKPWLAVRDAFKPKTECVWVNDFAVKACARWLKGNDPGLVWVEHVAFGKELSRISGVPYYGERGMSAEGQAIEARTGSSAVLSIQANGEGRNLQAWSRNLIASCPSSAATFEQLLGRTHRMGQRADEVIADVLVTSDLHVDAFIAARNGAHYLQDSLGQRQKLLTADIIVNG